MSFTELVDSSHYFAASVNALTWTILIRLQSLTNHVAIDSQPSDVESLPYAQWVVIQAWNLPVKKVSQQHVQITLISSSFSNQFIISLKTPGNDADPHSIWGCIFFLHILHIKRRWISHLNVKVVMVKHF